MANYPYYNTNTLGNSYYGTALDQSLSTQSEYWTNKRGTNPYQKNNLFAAGLGTAGLFASGFAKIGNKKLWDYYVSGLRYAEEYSPGGMLKTFQFSSFFSQFETATQDITITPELLRSNKQYRQYLGKVINTPGAMQRAMREGLHLKGGQLLFAEGGDVALKYARAMRVSEKTSARLGDAYARVVGANIPVASSFFRRIIPNKLKPEITNPVAGDMVAQIIGGHTRSQHIGRQVNMVGTELVSRFNRLLKIPFESEPFRTIFGGVQSLLKKHTGYTLNFAVKESTGLKMLGNLSVKYGIGLSAAVLGYQTLDYMFRKSDIFNNTALDQGLTAGLATVGIKANLLASEIAETTGLHAYREKQESIAPGSTELTRLMAFPLIGGMAGSMAAYGAKIFTMQKLQRQEGLSPGAAAIKAEEILSNFSGTGIKQKIGTALTKPTGLYSRQHRIGALIRRLATKEKNELTYKLIGKIGPTKLTGLLAAGIGLASIVPFLPGALIPGTRPDELKRIYSGKQEVAVRKGRWWTFGRSSYEGDRISHFQKHWYPTMLDRGRDIAIWGEDEPSPLEKLYKREFTYELEKKHYYDRPYPLCFHPDTEIYTNDGYKEIKNINIGDKVLNKNGNWTNVLYKSSRQCYENKLIEITIAGDNRKLKVTPKHKVLVLKNTNKTAKRNNRCRDKIKTINNGALEWIEAANINRHDFVVIPTCSNNTQDNKIIIDLSKITNRPYTDTHIVYDQRATQSLLNASLSDLPTKKAYKKYQVNYKILHQLKARGGYKNWFSRYIEIDKQIAYFLGFYLAEGSLTTYGINFALNKSEADTYGKELLSIAKEKFDANGKIQFIKNSNSIKVIIYSQILQEFIIGLLGTTKANNKKIPNNIFNWPNNLKKQIIKSLIRGDGSTTKLNEITFTSASSSLAMDLRLLLLSIGIKSSFKKNIPKQNWATSIIYNRIIPKNISYQLSISGDSFEKFAQFEEEVKSLKTTGDRKGEIVDNYLYIPVRKVNIIEYSKEVYDITVENEQSFLTTCIVHNSSLPFEDVPLIGPLLSSTIGQLIKPAKLMHTEEFMREGPEGTEYIGEPNHFGERIASEIGEKVPDAPVSPYSLTQTIGKQAYVATEMVGLPGFIASSIKENLTGTPDLFDTFKQLESARRIDGIERWYWDKELGDIFMTNEAFRRLYPHKRNQIELYNPIKNTMPDWLPSSGELSPDFQTGDPFTKIRSGELRLPGAGYCVKPEVMVLTDSGYKQIKDIEPNKDKTLTRIGWQNITDKTSRKYNGSIINIEAIGGYKQKVALTPEHQVLAVKTSTCKYHKNATKSRRPCKRSNFCNKMKCELYKNYKIEWIQAKDLEVGDHVIYPIKNKVENNNEFIFDFHSLVNIENNQVSLDLDNNQYTTYRKTKYGLLKHITGNFYKESFENNWFVYGLYISKGSIDTAISFTFHQNETYLVDKIIEFYPEAKIYYRKTEKAINVAICNKAYTVLFKNLFGSSINKRLPKNLSYLQFIDLLSGWIQGDGHIVKEQYCLTISDKYNALLSSLLFYLHKFNISFSIKHRKNKNCYNISFINTKDLTLNLVDYKNISQSSSKTQTGFYIDSFKANKITNITTENYSGEVYDLSVNKASEFTTSFIIHNSQRFPELKGIDPADYPLIHKYKILCLDANTLIPTQNDFKKIKDINIDKDLVLNQNGDFVEVNALLKSQESKESYELKTFYNYQPIITSADHIFLIANRKGEIQQKQIKDITNKEYLLFPMINFNNNKNICIGDFCDVSETSIKYIDKEYYAKDKGSFSFIKFNLIADNKLGRVFGLYLAEGNISKTKITWTFNAQEKNTLGKEIREFANYLGCQYHDRITSTNTYQINISNKLLAKFFNSLFSTGSAHKNIKISLYNFSKEFTQGIIEGYIDGDGYIATTKSTIVCRASSVSQKLLLQIRHYCLSLGIVASIRQRTGRYKGKQAWVLDITRKDIPKLNCFFTNTDNVPQYNTSTSVKLNFKLDNFIAIRIKTIKKITTSNEWYDLNLNGPTNLYATHIGIVHNSDVAPYTDRFKNIESEIRAARKRNDWTEYEENIYQTTKEQIKARKIKKEFDEYKYLSPMGNIFDNTKRFTGAEASSELLAKLNEQSSAGQKKPGVIEKLFGGYWELLAHNAETSIDQLTPLSPGAKFVHTRSPIEDYERTQVYGTTNAFWSHPIRDFFKPTAQIVANEFGFSDVPEGVQNRRNLEEYFDILKYVKYSRLSNIAKANKDKEAAAEFEKKKDQTLFGINPFTRNYTSIFRSLPRRDRDYFNAFSEADTIEERERILELVPENERALYAARWKLAFADELKRAKKSKILSKSELEEADNILSGIYNEARTEGFETNKNLMAEYLKTKAPGENYSDWYRRTKLLANIALPGPDWIGFCIPSNQKIINQDYLLIPAKNVKIEDKISTHKDTGIIKSIYTREVNEQIHKLTVAGNTIDKLLITGNHPILALQAEKCPFNLTVGSICSDRSENWRCNFCTNKLYKKYKASWIKPTEITTDTFLLYPLLKNSKKHLEIDLGKEIDWSAINCTVDKNTIYPKSGLRNPMKRKIVIDEAVAWLIGYYLAEGNVWTTGKRTRGVQFTAHIKERPILELASKIIIKYFGLKPRIIERHRDSGSSLTLVVASSMFAAIIDYWVGHYCDKKYTPKWLEQITHKSQIALLEGLLNGDGSKDGKDKLIITNYNLCIMAKRIWETIGKPASLRKISRRNGKPQYEIRPVEFPLKAILFDKYIAYRVTKNELIDYKGTVYDFEVPNIHSYLTEIAILHNSPSVDMEDVKLKLIQNLGESMYDYDLWQKRAASLPNKPYINEETIKAILEPEELTAEEMENRVNEIILANNTSADVFIREGGGDSNSTNIQIEQEIDLNNVTKRFLS